MADSTITHDIPARAARRLRVTAVVAGVLGVAASAGLWRARQHVEEREFAQALQAEAQGLVALTAREVETVANVLDSIRSLHTISAQITDRDFREFVEKGMVHQRTVLHAFGFAQGVEGADRRNFERPATPDQPRAVRIVEHDGQGGFRPAPDRTRFFPVTYQFPDDGLGVPNGCDLAVAPGVADAIGRMSLAGGIAVTGPGWGPEGRDYLAMAPIIYVAADAQGRPQGGFLYGFAAGLLRPPAILEPALRQAENHGLELTLVDRTPELAGPDPADRPAATLPLPVLGQVWTLRCVARPAFQDRYQTQQPRLLLLAGLAVTGLLTLQLAVLSRRAATVERAVQERTGELRTANAELERAMAERRRLEREVLEIAAQEKQRVGRDLHDSLGQKLTGATYLSRALAEELTEAGSPHRDAAAKINETLKEATAQSRRIARGLSPVDLSAGGLADALRGLAEEISSIYGVTVTFHGDDAPGVPDGAMAAHLYQIAQEAMNNAIRHGKATEIAVVLEKTGEDGVMEQWSDGKAAHHSTTPPLQSSPAPHGELVIEDNGSGLPAGATQNGGMGLRIMRYRAGLIGGDLKIERGREGGTVVVCRF